jgi:hypothetical protein
MDIPTVITALLSSGLVGLDAARWLTTRFIDQQLAKDLKNYDATLAEKLAIFKGAIDERLSAAKTSLEAQLHQGVEEYLGDKAAERQYRLDARKRLYSVIGPLRFQLVVASADFSARVEGIGAGRQLYSHRWKDTSAGAQCFVYCESSRPQSSLIVRWPTRTFL